MDILIRHNEQWLGVFQCEALEDKDEVHSIKQFLIEKLSVVAGKIYFLQPGKYFAEAICIAKQEGSDILPVKEKSVPQWFKEPNCRPDLFYEKVCGAVVFYRGEQKKYVIIQNLSGHVGFPKGHTENGEDEMDTALREVREETGLLVKLIPGFRHQSEYVAVSEDERIEKTAVYFLAAVDQDEKITIQQEEIPEWWLLPYEEALKSLNFENDRNILQRAQYYCI